jgi:DNA-binding protein HU-beta|tara:strand:- start:188 stop:556 length:369 start_codon:yes stop_codon:yes gene_type:complete
LYQKKYIKDLYENINLYIWQSKILKIQIKMTKAELVTKISSNLGLEKNEVLATVEDFMEEVKNSLSEGENVYLRGFGSFIVKKRAEKTGRNISKNVTIKIPAHSIPSFKPAKIFVEDVKNNN